MNYPQQVTQAWLDNRLSDADLRIVRIELHGTYNYRPVPISGRTNKRYIFVYDPKTACHALNIPESIWMANDGAMARDLLRTTTHHHQLVTFILPIPKKKAIPQKVNPLPKATKAPKPKTAEDAAMAVLGG